MIDLTERGEFITDDNFKKKSQKNIKIGTEFHWMFQQFYTGGRSRFLCIIQLQLFRTMLFVGWRKRYIRIRTVTAHLEAPSACRVSSGRA